MIGRVLAIAATELRIVRRNRWVAIATVLMVLFALALTFAGAAPTGTLKANLLTVSVTSMTTLATYLAPLLGLLMAFDAIAGDVERGGLALLLTYPATRTEILIGKFLAHLGTLAFAIAVGLGSAGIAAAAAGGADAGSISALIRLIWSAILLGAAFLALGYAVSATTRNPGAAAGIAAGVWLVLVVLYDIGLLGALVYDNGGVFTREVFPWLLAANPADAFRLFNVASSEQVALATGLTGAADVVPGWLAPLSLVLWPVLALALARTAFGRVEP